MTIRHHRSMKTRSFLRPLLLLIACGWLCHADAGVVLFTPKAATAAPKPVALTQSAQSAPASITVTSSLPVMFMVSPALTAPFTALAGPATNRVVLTADQRLEFFRGVLASFPVTNLSVTVSWVPVAVAAKYRIYFGQSASNYSQMVEVPAPASVYGTSIWHAWGTNFVNMTAVDSNGVESVYGTEIRYVPQYWLGIQTTH